MKKVLLEGESLNKQGSSGGSSSAKAIPLWDVCGRKKKSEAIDRYIDLYEPWN